MLAAGTSPDRPSRSRAMCVCAIMEGMRAGDAVWCSGVGRGREHDETEHDSVRQVAAWPAL